MCGSESFTVTGNPCQRRLETLGSRRSWKGDKQDSCTGLGTEMLNR